MKTVINDLFFILIVTELYSQPINISTTSTTEGIVNANEPSVVINPTDNQNIIVGANYRESFNYNCSQNNPVASYSTTNGGLSWIYSILDKMGYNKSVDPSVSFSPSGKSYFGYLGFNPQSASNPQNSAVFIARSDDKGLTWNPGNIVNISSSVWDTDHYFYDKPNIHTGRKLINNFYRSFIGFVKIPENSPVNEIKFSYLTNDNTHSSVETINYPDNKEAVQNPIIVTDKNHHVYVFFYAKEDLPQDQASVNLIKVVKSTDDGNNFNFFPVNLHHEKTVAEINPVDPNEGNFKLNSFQSVAVDLSDYAYQNHIYVVWTQELGSSNPNNTKDIYLAKSTDGGNSWSTKTDLLGNNDGDQFFPTISVDDSGRVSIFYYQRDNIDSYTVQPKYITSFDGGDTFVNDQWFETYIPSINFSNTYLVKAAGTDRFIGDYISISSSSEKIVMVYTGIDQYASMPEACGNPNFTDVEIIQGIILPNRITVSVQTDVNQNTYNDGGVSIDGYWVANNSKRKISAIFSHNFSAPEFYQINGEEFKFRNWNDVIYSENKFKSEIIYNYDYSYLDYEIALTSDHYSTQPLTVTNYLEGGTSTDEFKLTWQDASLTYNLDYGTNYDAFIYQAPTNDDYTIEALPITAQRYGTNWTFLSWNTGSTSTTIQNIKVPDDIPPSGSFTANYKGIQRSNNSTTYNNNGQRKFVRTDDGYLHHIYESMGKVFYELSSDGGANWQIINMPGWEGETPSIDYFQNFVVVAVQYDAFSGIPSVELISFKKSGSTYIQAGLQTVEVLTSSAKIPVIAIRKGDGYPYEPSRFLVIWKDNTSQQAGLYAVAGNLLSDGSLELLGQYPVTFITGTNASSSNPTVASSKIYASLFQLAWQQNTAGTNSKINYCTIGVSSDPAITVYAIQNISLGNGFGQNITPSIIEYPYNSQSIAKITWVGIRQVDDNPVTEYKTFYRSLESGTFKSFGDVARFPVINKTNNNNAFAISWNESNSNTNKFTPSWKSLRYIYPLNVDGKAVQLNNGSSYNGSSNSSGMFGMVFSESTTPYTFSKSLDLASLTPPDKITSNSIALGREGVIYKDSAQFYFAMGDIILNNQTIDFVDLPDTVFIVDNQMLNQYLYSIPFEVNDNSILYYTVQYGISDSASAVNVLHLNDYLSFKVELIDDLSGEALGQYDDITFTKTNVAQYDNISYKVNTEGIGNRYVRLRLTTSNNFNPSYSVTQRFADESVLGKSSLQEVNYKGSLGVDKYDLAQNYPNPFNPSTTIKYQIPNAGIVTLKIYDILGREVTTLVDEFKNEGRYEVNFNANKLASGVYIYTIKSNDFTSSKKLLLLK